MSPLPVDSPFIVGRILLSLFSAAFQCYVFAERTSADVGETVLVSRNVPIGGEKAVPAILKAKDDAKEIQIENEVTRASLHLQPSLVLDPILLCLDWQRHSPSSCVVHVSVH